MRPSEAAQLTPTLGKFAKVTLDTEEFVANVSRDSPAENPTSSEPLMVTPPPRSSIGPVTLGKNAVRLIRSLAAGGRATITTSGPGLVLAALSAYASEFTSAKLLLVEVTVNVAASTTYAASKHSAATHALYICCRKREEDRMGLRSCLENASSLTKKIGGRGMKEICLRLRRSVGC
jgi:hypothetical protein